MRWPLFKAGFSRCVEKGERIRPSRKAKHERGIWQRQYWEQQIRDEGDLARHVDYIHFNPVKHGWGARLVDWPHSTLHGFGVGAWEMTREITVSGETLGFLRQPNLRTQICTRWDNSVTD